MIDSLIAFQQESPYGMLPVWSYAGLETWCMIGYHAVAVIADAYMKGMRGFDADDGAQGHDGHRRPMAPTAACSTTCSSAMCP